MKFARVALVATIAGTVATASAQSGSLFTAESNNGSGGVYLDLTPTGLPLFINSFDLYFSGEAGTTVEVAIYTRSGSYVDVVADPTAWTLSQVVTATRAGTTELANLMLDSSILVDGLTGIYMHAINQSLAGIRYTGTAANPPQTTFTNADLTLFSDVARTGGTAFSGGPFTPRTFAGQINYTVIPTPASLAILGLGGLGLARRRR
ncbi:MAG: hypothetical protein LAT64_02655 [Phycisphaerales bacterium]|nr:hypothetical protein [Planctomycetota bacterium]MCH8507658.1 hypothetical protein [Phycisphaerales bacterium]